MSNRLLCCCLAGSAVACCAGGWGLWADEKDDAKLDPAHARKMTQGLELFKTKVRPVLLESCVKCHGGEARKADFDLTTREGLLKGDAETRVVVAGNHKASHLWKLISHNEMPHMPHKAAKLPEATIQLIGAWIDLGAPYDQPLLDKGKPVAAGPMQVTDKDRQFWSFRPLKYSPAPRTTPFRGEPVKWVRTDVDCFVYEKLREKGLVPNPPASRRVLIRRAYFDLLGLPPTPEEIDAFVNDPDPHACDKLIDRLLDNPHHGERWARHWLDVARFGESHGFEQDYDRPHAYHYRDFVIKALNADMPYDQFVRWQIAGDELAPDEPLALMATGFLGAGVFPTQLTEKEFESARYDEMDDMTATLGTSMLGLTIGCARCHDHKFDPIPTRDYYRLLSTFTTTIRSEIELDLDPPRTQAAWNQWKKAMMPLAAELAGKTVLLARSPLLLNPPFAQLQQRTQKQVAAKPPLTKVMVTSERFKPMKHHADDRGFPHFYKETYILNRGDVHQKQEVATQSFLQVLMTAAEPEQKWSRPPAGERPSYRRTALAGWITDAECGGGRLLARVIVNRLWQHHFGRGIVGTPNDFGFQGERPTHPELLDWLATELIRNGWRLKPIHKLLMTSSVYLQTSDHVPERARVDPQNTLCWRQSYRRLEAETIRDNMLAVSGVLDRTLFGPGTLDEGMKRRSIYFMIKRSRLIPILALFDMPEPLVSQASRPATTIAPQALLFLNNPQVRSYARAFAARLPAGSLEDAVTHAYHIALGRKPTSAELADNAAFLQSQIAVYHDQQKPNARALALVDFCQVVMGLNEFVYVE